MEDVELICARGWEQRKQAEELAAPTVCVCQEEKQDSRTEQPGKGLHRFWGRAARVTEVILMVEGVLLAVLHCWGPAVCALAVVLLFHALERGWLRG